MTSLDWILSLALAVALTGTAILCRYALSNSLIDVPNSRSSHVQPILMGGGVAIVVSFVLSSVLLALTGQTQWPLIPAIAVLGGGVSVIGFSTITIVFQHVGGYFAVLSSRSRVWFLFGGLAPIHLFGTSINLSWVGYVFGSLYLVWLLNLYNFMDGIDGLASMDAVFVCHYFMLFLETSNLCGLR